MELGTKVLARYIIARRIKIHGDYGTTRPDPKPYPFTTIRVDHVSGSASPMFSSDWCTLVVVTQG